RKGLDNHRESSSLHEATLMLMFERNFLVDLRSLYGLDDLSSSRYLHPMLDFYAASWSGLSPSPETKKRRLWSSYKTSLSRSLRDLMTTSRNTVPGQPLQSSRKGRSRWRPKAYYCGR